MGKRILCICSLKNCVVTIYDPKGCSAPCICSSKNLLLLCSNRHQPHLSLSIIPVSLCRILLTVTLGLVDIYSSKTADEICCLADRQLFHVRSTHFFGISLSSRQTDILHHREMKVCRRSTSAKRTESFSRPFIFKMHLNHCFVWIVTS